MLLVVNPNPAIDRVSVVDFRRGSTIRPLQYLEWPGGSGVHAAHVAHRLGAEAEIVALLGGQYGAKFLALAAGHGLIVHAVDSGTETRGTYSIVDRVDGNVCDIAEPGQHHDPVGAMHLLAAVEAASADAGLAVVSGSVPLGIAPSVHADSIRLLKARGVRAIADLTGAPLALAIDAQPWMIKPSLEELQRDGVVSTDGRQAFDAARSWLDRGVDHVCVSLAAQGVLWVSAEGCRRLWLPADGAPFNTIGAGDTLVGATAAAILQDLDVASALRQGVAAATANLSHIEPGDCTRDEVASLIESVETEDVDVHSFAALLA